MGARRRRPIVEAADQAVCPEPGRWVRIAGDDDDPGLVRIDFGGDWPSSLPPSIEVVLDDWERALEGAQERRNEWREAWARDQERDERGWL